MAAAAERDIHDGAALGVEAPPAGVRKAIGKKLAEMAPLLWATDYTEIRTAEVTELIDMGVFGAAVKAKDAAPLSSYRARNLNNNKEKTLNAIVTQSADLAATALRHSQISRRTRLPSARVLYRS